MGHKRKIKIKPVEGACQRTINRLTRCKGPHWFELLIVSVNDTLKGDGFYPGETMLYVRINVEENGLTRNFWEGWLPESEVDWYFY